MADDWIEPSYNKKKTINTNKTSPYNQRNRGNARNQRTPQQNYNNNNNNKNVSQYQIANKKYNELRDFVTTNATNLTVEMCKEKIKIISKKKQENDSTDVVESYKFELIYNLIKGVYVNKNCLVVLEKLAQDGFFPKHQKITGRKGEYSVLHGAAWLHEELSNELFSEIIKLIHSLEYNIFSKNGKGENALSSVLAKKELNEEKKIFRYMEICKITNNQIDKISSSIFNKISLDKKIKPMWIDKFRFILRVNPEQSLKHFAKNLIRRKPSASLNDPDVAAITYFDLLKISLSDIDNGYKGTKPNDKSLELFFEKNKYPIKNSQELLKFFWIEAKKTAFDEKRSIEQKSTDLEALGIFIGQLAKNGYLLEDYQKFIFDCLSDNQSFEFVSIVNKETIIKMAIRACVQSQIIDEKIAAMLIQKKKNNLSGFLNYHIDSLTKKTVIKTEMKKEVTVESDESDEDAYEYEFFNGMNLNNFNNVVDKSLKDIEKRMLNNNYEMQAKITKKVLFNLIEKISKQMMQQIKIVMEKLLKIIDVKLFLVEKEKIKDKHIQRLVLDSPNADNVWKAICDYLKK